MIPTYRRPVLLRRAIQSALGQTHRDLEVWVFDNASGDETEQVVAALSDTDGRLHYHRHPRNLGSFANFRSAIDSVRTPFFSILADDDVLLPNFHLLALETFAQYPALMLVGLDCLHAEVGGALLRHREIGPGTYLPPHGLLEMLRQGHLNWTSVLFRREALELIGGLDPKTDLYLDFDVLIRLAGRAPFAVRPEAGAVYFYHDAASSSSASIDDDRWNAFAAIVAKLADNNSLPESVRAQALALLKRQFRSTLIKAGVGAARRGNVRGAQLAATELELRLQHHRAAFVVRVAAQIGRSAPGRFLLGLGARVRRPYSGQRVTEQLRDVLGDRQLAGLVEPFAR